MKLFGQATRTIVQHQVDWQQWQNQQLGKTLLQHERSLLTPLMQKKLGRHLFQISIAGCEPLFENSPIPIQTFAQMSVAGEPFHRQTNCSLVVDPCDLAIGNNIMDAVVLHHILEYSHNPHQVLREAHRTLTSGGQLFLVGFNPCSLMGLRKLLTPFSKAPCGGDFRSEMKLVDWLKLLGFQVELTQYAFFGLPFNLAPTVRHSPAVERLGRKYNCFFGSTYAIVARKKTASMMPLKEKKLAHRVLDFPIAEPTARSIKTLNESSR